MKPPRILYLEDNDTDVVLLRHTLRRHGVDAELTHARSSEEFRDALAQGDVDLILADSAVPGFDGTMALEFKQQHFPRVPFVCVSGAAQEERAAAMLAAGATDYLSKDVPSQLAATVRRHLESSAQARATDRLLRLQGGRERLVAAVQELSLARSHESIRGIIARTARQLTGADGATFVLRDGVKCFYVDEDAIAPLWKGQRFPLEACVSGWAMLHREPAIIPDIYSDPRVPADAYRPTFVKSMVMVPIRTSDPIGAIGNYWAQPHHAGPEEVELLQALANTAAVALENVQIYTELEARVHERTLQLEAANRELEAFSYSVSHDLRAPLRGVSGFTQILANSLGPAAEPQVRMQLDRIQGEARKMNTLIEDLLRLAKLARTDLHRAEVDLSRIAHDLIAQLRVREPDRVVEAVCAPGVHVEGDAGLLRVVLENLLSNAWKYSAKRAQARLEFGVEIQSDGATACFVRDNGAGFDMRHVAKLFTPFQRLHRPEDFAGHGVGLATVQRIIHKHGGRIWAHAAPEQGATFYFTVPPPGAVSLARAVEAG